MCLCWCFCCSECHEVSVLVFLLQRVSRGVRAGVSVAVSVTSCLCWAGSVLSAASTGRRVPAASLSATATADTAVYTTVHISRPTSRVSHLTVKHKRKLAYTLDEHCKINNKINCLVGSSPQLDLSPVNIHLAGLCHFAPPYSHQAHNRLLFLVCPVTPWIAAWSLWWIFISPTAEPEDLCTLCNLISI